MMGNIAARMTTFRRLAVASTAATFLLVGIGGLVRATKSGLGCGTSWPHCPGDVTRALVIELSHRTVAGIVILLLGMLVVVAYRNRHDHPGLLHAASVAFGLVLGQALLGAIVVWLELEAESVVLHLATAMALLALLVHITARALVLEGKLHASSDRGISRSASWAAGSVLVLLLVGSYVTGRDAGYVFPDWPLMNGGLVPDLSVDVHAIHFAHRALAGIVGVVVFVVGARTIRRRKEFPLQAKLSHIAVGAYAVEVLIGALNVWTRLNSASVTLHLAVGAVVWASLVGVAVVSRPELATDVSTRSLRSATALEQGA
jgi:cytochrome c oxidase assembly protein subunit 15